jgi:hypothetical protein
MRKGCAVVEESAITARVGRKKRWAEDMQARFPEGTFERIELTLGENEDRTDFVREAVERELQRRERGRSRTGLRVRRSDR